MFGKEAFERINVSEVNLTQLCRASFSPFKQTKKQCQCSHSPQKPATRCFMLSLGHISHTSSSTVRCFSTTPIAWPALVTPLVSFSCNPPSAPGWFDDFDDDVCFSLFLANKTNPRKRKRGYEMWNLILKFSRK